MGLVVPESCISTVDAYSQMLKADSEWCRCSEGWKAAGRSYLPILAAPTIAEIDERQEALSAKLYRAVTGGEIALFAYAGGRLLRVYSDDPRVESELRIWGRIRAPIGDSPERREIDKAPLCFREADWRAWFAPSETAPATAAAPAPPRPRGRPADRRAAVREHYPNGLPDVPTPAIAADLKAKGVSVSDSTIDRERRRR